MSFSESREARQPGGTTTVESYSSTTRGPSIWSPSRVLRFITGVYFEDFDSSDLEVPSQNRLQISGVDLTPDQQETAQAIFRTIRSLASEPQEITGEPQGDQGPIRSDEDIDPNVCNLVHNINACTPEELEEAGIAPLTGSIPAGATPLAPRTRVEGEPEPLYVDEEPQYEVQSYNEAARLDCGLAGGTVFLDSDGEVGCIINHDLDDDGEGETQGQPPVIAPTPEPLPAE